MNYLLYRPQTIIVFVNQTLNTIHLEVDDELFMLNICKFTLNEHLQNGLFVPEIQIIQRLYFLIFRCLCAGTYLTHFSHL